MLPERLTARDYLSMGLNPNRLQKFMHPNVIDHRARYKFAAKILNATFYGASILDAASGSGWGSHHLRENTTQLIIGIDCDPEAVAESRLHFERSDDPRLRFYQLDLLDGKSLFKKVGTVGSIVSFETIEHVRLDQAPTLLDNFRSILNKDGKLIVSTPNRLLQVYTIKEGQPWYPYHPYELSQDELCKLLEDNGWVVEMMYGQRLVDPQKYLALAKAVYPIRLAALKRKLPWDHWINRLPLAILSRFAVLSSNEIVQQICENGRQPLFLTAVCKKAS